MKKIAFFDAKPYDRQWFDQENTKYDIGYLETRLTPATSAAGRGE